MAETTEYASGTKSPLLFSKAAATRREKPVPEYVNDVGERDASSGPDWLLIGFEQRVRLERRDNDFRVDQVDDDRILSRSRIFFGVRPSSLPLGLILELQDSRRFGSVLPATTSDTNKIDLLQGAVIFDFRHINACKHPLTMEVGRLSFDAVDRRLLARNRFRNTTNAFDGLRINWGEVSGSPAVSGFILHPVRREVGELDTSDRQRWLFGATASWQAAGSPVVFEPYYLGSTHRDGVGALHTAGLHTYGAIPDTGFDYDFNGVTQWGFTFSRHRAFAFHAELGDTFQGAWQPRLAGWISYASGNDRMTEDREERFDPLFGASHVMYGFSDFFSWQNLITPVLQLSLKPTSRTQLQIFHRGYWLEEATDSFVKIGIQDPSGNGGTFLGQAFDVSFRQRVGRLLDIELQYGHFFPGSFLGQNGHESDSNIVFVSFTIRPL